MKFLTDYIHALDEVELPEVAPLDVTDRESENTAVELALPDNFSTKAKACWDYFEGTAFIFKYKERLVVTDEGLYLTAHGDGSSDAPIGSPRWICDSWEELEKALEKNYDDLVEIGQI